MRRYNNSITLSNLFCKLPTYFYMYMDALLVRKHLLEWFSANKRSLPWREDKDAYRIWLSEIILQQTRVAQGLPYYLRFIERFPKVNVLADAEEQEVIKLWQGLGYYSRARNLHASAKEISKKYAGIFPDSYDEVIKLKGVGDYTASAILSIAYGLPHAVLDGNVYRVLSRLCLIDTLINANEAKAIFKKIAQELLDPEQPGNYNEAIMELGATVCTPQNPVCHSCPLQNECMAHLKGEETEYPKKAESRPVTNRYLHYFLVKDARGLYLHARGKGDIWQGLYDLPLLEKDTAGLAPQDEIEKALGCSLKSLEAVKTMKHQLTHRSLHIIFYLCDVAADCQLMGDGIIFVEYAALNEYPLPKPIELFLGNVASKVKI